MKTSSKQKTNEIKPRRVALSIAQILAGTGKGPTIAGKRKKETSKRKKPLKPILPPKSMVVILKDKPEKSVYHRRMLDYKHCGLLQRYIGLGGKILSRRQTRLTAKQQRYVAKTIKTARIMGLLPFTNKERAFFRSCTMWIY
jgi:small subunit ribosomal protein S18